MAARALVVVLLGIALAATAGCDRDANGESEVATTTTSPSLGDGVWELRIDRRLYVDPLPMDSLTEDDFQPFAAERAYRIVISEQGSRVSIEAGSREPLYEGRRTVATANRTQYDLGEGPWGRLVVWPADGVLQAEFALYGSGRAYIRCERGTLERLL